MFDRETSLFLFSGHDCWSGRKVLLELCFPSIFLFIFILDPVYFCHRAYKNFEQFKKNLKETYT